MPRHGRKLKNQFRALKETPPRTKKNTTKLVLGVWPPTRNLTGAEAPRVPNVKLYFGYQWPFALRYRLGVEIFLICVETV